MGFFSPKPSEEVINLKWELIDLRPEALNSISFVTVDCRLCKSTDFGVLLHEVVWGLQSCKASYAWCRRNDKWVAETQGSGLAGKTNHNPSRTTWSVFDPKQNYAIWITGDGVEVAGLTLPSRAIWALGDFNERIAGTKSIVEDFLTNKGDPESMSLLGRLLAEDPI